VVAVMNAQWIGRWDVAPRSHPNDGLLDVFDADLELDDRLKARPRLLTGTHVPHPGIRQQRAAEVAITLDRPTPLHLDGERVGTATTLEITVVPGAVTCVV
jgi:diacylglycerol kinase family enzyme